MADEFVVDTDVVSYMFRNDTRASAYESFFVNALPVISFMTLAELSLWSLQRNWGQARRDHMTAHLERYVVAFADEAVCIRWAEVSLSARRNGRPIQVADAWIAATAIELRLPLLTNNRNDFAGVDGLVLLG